MFTGLVETAGKLQRVEERGDGSRLVISHGGVLAEVAIGESIACNGACLTVAEHSADEVQFDVLRQTLDVTNLGTLRAGDLVNLERALRAGDRLGGHFVTGHIDCTAKIVRWEQSGADWVLELAHGSVHDALVVPKGCIALDGISLTIADVLPDRLRFWIIPHTREVTNLSGKADGQRLNIEFDLLGKYVQKNAAAQRTT